MKKIVLLFVLFAGFSLLSMAQTMTVHINGLVINDSTGAPVANHEVIIVADSTPPPIFYFYTTRITNASGAFDCTIQNVPTGAPVTIHLRTLDCMNIMHEVNVLSTNSPITVTLSICDGEPGCQAAFTYTVDPVTDQQIHFFSTSTPAPAIVSYLWDFGDGMTSVTGDPWHVYAIPGVYHVCLSIVTTTGCTSTKCEEITVGNPVGCQAYFTSSHDSIHPLVYHFLDQSQGSPTHWTWTFGDGHTSTVQNPEHSYAVAGTYNVCLQIQGDSCSSDYCDTIQVGASPYGCMCYVGFWKNLMTVTFEGHTTSTLPTEYTWNMGDPAATILHGQNITFTYSAPGTYYVVLTTVDSFGCTSTTEQIVEVTNTVSLYGFVFAGDPLADHGYVELIRVDTANVLTVVDTKQFGDSLGWYHFEHVLPGHYYLKATLSPTSVYYGLFTPTYHIDALNWTNAQLVELGEPQSPYDIHLRHVTAYSPGPGNISGTITQSTKDGTPVSGIEVLLLNAQSQPLGYTVTDAAGQYTFANAAFGAYTVYPEILGKTTTPATFTMSGANPSPIANFTVNAASVVYGINDSWTNYFSAVSDVMPNPISDMATIRINAKNQINAGIIISDANGKVMVQQPADLHSGENTLNLQTTSVASGSYFLRIAVNGKTVMVKRFIKK